MTAIPNEGLQLRSLVKESGELELRLVRVPVPQPARDEVVVRIEASPINPSDQGMMFGAADLATIRRSGTADAPVVTAQVPADRMGSMQKRLGRSLAPGNEGAGVVIATGASPEARALAGRTVALFAGEMYSQYRCVQAGQCLPLPAGLTPRDGAAAFVNPLTALGMVETMRREGHTGLVHTAAASNLGQMLNRVCIEDGVALVNIVRSAEQEARLRDLGARHVCNSRAPDFARDLAAALAATGATLAFDAIGGGRLAGQILAGMEAAITRESTEYSRYGSTVHKQVYVYGSLDGAPTVLDRTWGFSWGVAGWLLWPFLRRVGPARVAELQERIVGGLRTTFASDYTKEISLAQALDPAEVAVYAARGTGSKYLLNPGRA